MSFHHLNLPCAGRYPMKVANSILSINNKTSLFFIGQAGFIIKSKKGSLLGIDLYLSNCVERVEGHDGFKRLLPCILEPDEITLDHLIATHQHTDHFDIDSMSILIGNDKTKLYASYDCQEEAAQLNLDAEKITYVKCGDHCDADDFSLDFVFCDHGTSAPGAVGVVISVDNHKIYIAGDTCLRLDKVEEIQKHGHFDVMIAPINGAYGNLNEVECVTLSRALSPDLTIPCHYGMFASHGGNPELFRKGFINEVTDRRYLLMAMGERYDIS